MNTSAAIANITRRVSRSISGASRSAFTTRQLSALFVAPVRFYAAANAVESTSPSSARNTPAASSSSSGQAPPKSRAQYVMDRLRDNRMNDAYTILNGGRAQISLLEYCEIIDLVYASTPLKYGVRNDNRHARFIEHACGLLDEFHPNAVLPHSVIRAASHCYRVLHRPNKLRALYERATKTENFLDDRGLLHFATAFSDINEREYALQVFDKIRKPSASSVFLDGYLRIVEGLGLDAVQPDVTPEKKHQLLSLISLDKVEELLAAPDKNPQTLQHRKRLEKLILIYGLKGNTERAFEFLNEMLSDREKPPSILAYRNLLLVGGDLQNDELVLNCYKEMKEYHADRVWDLRWGLLPVVEACLRAGDLAEAIQASETMLFWPSTSRGINHCLKGIPKLLKAFEGHTGAEEHVKFLKKSQAAPKPDAPAVAAVSSLDAIENTAESKRKTTGVSAVQSLRMAIADGNAEECAKSLDIMSKSGAFISTLDEINAVKVLSNTPFAVKGISQICELRKAVTVPAQKLTWVVLIDSMLDSKMLVPAHDMLKKLQNDKIKLEYGNYCKFIMKLADGGRPDLADDILKPMEETVPAQVDFPPNYLYNAILQEYSRRRDFRSEVSVYKRLISPENMLKPFPNIATYNAMLFGLIRDWNLDGFDKMYTTLINNMDHTSPKPVKTESERWDQYQQERTAHLAQNPNDPEYVFVPSYVIPNRATENLNLTRLIAMNQLDETLAAFRKSILSPHLSRFGQPTAATYDNLSKYFLRKSKNPDWNNAKLVKGITAECLSMLQKFEVNSECVDDVLKTVEGIVEKHVTAMVKESPPVSAEAAAQ